MFFDLPLLYINNQFYSLIGIHDKPVRAQTNTNRHHHKINYNNTTAIINLGIGGWTAPYGMTPNTNNGGILV